MKNQEDFMRYWTQAQPLVASYLSALLAQPTDVDDLLQEVAVTLFRRFSEYDPQRKFVAWALGVAKMKVLSARRSMSRTMVCRDPAMPEALAQTYAEISIELELRSEALRRCLEQVQGRSREVLNLHYVQAHKTHEVAKLLGMAHTAVRVMLSRVRSSLRECIGHRLTAGPAARAR